MAVLPDNDRATVAAELMVEGRVIAEHIPIAGGLTKPQHRAVVNALDQWLSDNAVSANNAIPQPQRGILTAQEKAIYMMRIIAKRYLSGV